MQFRQIFPICAVIVLLILASGCISDNEQTTPVKSAATGSHTVGDISVSDSTMDTVLTSIYQQLPNLDVSFIDFTITNSGTTPKTIRVESEIQGFTEKSVNSIEVPAGSTKVLSQTPQLKISAVPREITSASLHYRIEDQDGRVIDEQTRPITIYARDTMIWGAETDGEWEDLSPFIGAWVTPHDPAIDALVRKAVEYHPQHSMAGYQCGESCSKEEWAEYTDAQAKAIYDTLKTEYKLSYVDSAMAYGAQNENPQRVRLPSDSLATASANCIDGTVLYASALENVGINPVIVLLPTHAFVCYDRTPGASGESLGCVETTMIRDASFDAAADEAMKEYQAEMSNGNFASNKTQEFSVSELRERGIRPML